MTAKSSRRDLLLKLHDFSKNVSVFKMQGGIYEPCIRAAFAKSYEFALFAHDDSQSETGASHFCDEYLYSSTWDKELIVLGYPRR